MTLESKQDCARCRSLSTCWKPELSEKQIVVNLLVCRMQRGVARESSTKLLLNMVRPKIQKTARRMRPLRHVEPLADMMRDLETEAVVALLSDYRMGEATHPLRWLFGQPHGAIARYAQQEVQRTQRKRGRMFSYGSVSGEANDASFDDRLRRLNHVITGGKMNTLPAETSVLPDEYDPLAEIRLLTQDVLAVVDDGVTLPLDEYRIFRFCLTNAREDVRVPTSRLHADLAQRFRMPRKTISYLYGRAYRRVLEVVGQVEAHLRRRGLPLPKSAARRRQNVRLHRFETIPLSSEEIAEIVRIRKTNSRISVPDLAFAFGVEDTIIYRLQRRFQHASLSEIKAQRRV
jgi:hypothetical protein